MIVSQSKDNNCGPVAIINLMNWLGADYDEFPLSDILEAMKTSKMHDKCYNFTTSGMFRQDLISISRAFDIHLKRKIIESIPHLYSLIEKHSHGILCYDWVSDDLEECGSHYVTVLGATGNYIIAPNSIEGYKYKFSKKIIDFYWKNTKKGSKWTFFYVD